MKYKEINLDKVKNPVGKEGILFVDRDGKLKLGKIVFPNENEKDKTILFSIEVLDFKGE